MNTPPYGNVTRNTYDDYSVLDFGYLIFRQNHVVLYGLYIYIHIYISVYRTCLRSDLKASHILVLLGFGGRPNKNTCHGESLKFGYHPPAIYHSSGKWSMYR